MRKVIVAGGRDFSDRVMLKYVLHRLLAERDIIISGGAKTGADAIGESYAKHFGYDVIVYPADWDTHKKAAGPIRNGQMATISHVLVAFWDGQSKGTKNMIDTALRSGLEVHVYRYSND